MSELSPMEQDVYGYIESMIENEGYAPSVRDICRALGIRSTSTAHACLSRLDQKGYIKKDQGKSRALRLGRAKYSDGERMLRVPLLGRVTAARRFWRLKIMTATSISPSVWPAARATSLRCA